MTIIFDKHMEILKKDAKKRLAALWFIFSGIIFLLMVVQSLTDVYGTKLDQAWGWLFQNILPTLTLMVTIFSSEVIRGRNNTSAKDKVVDRFFFRLTFYISFLYLLLLMLTIILQPIILKNTDFTRIDFLIRSNLWLGPMQGLTTGLLGIFFVRSEK